MRNRYTIGAVCLLLLLISGLAWAKSASPHVPAPIDYSCHVDADCVVKDVGNCCGYYPACVNINATPDPEGVRAQCGKGGMASVCGFEDIQSCACVNNKCASTGGSSLQ